MAIQWFKDGDHPDVKMTADGHDAFCDKSTDGIMVYPGNWIITKTDGSLAIFEDWRFKQFYEEST